MIIRIQLFAGVRQAVDSEHVEVTAPEQATVGDLRAAAAAQSPELAPWLASSLFAVNGQYASDETPVNADSEVALIPPVSGG